MNPDNYYNFPPDWDEPDPETIEYGFEWKAEDGTVRFKEVYATIYPSGVVVFEHPETGDFVEEYDYDLADELFRSGSGYDPDYNPQEMWD